jgi:TRAP-type C4-dicarboxylate transport system substrate-binding protein
VGRLLLHSVSVSLLLWVLAGCAEQNQPVIAGATGVVAGTAGHAKWLSFPEQVSVLSNGELEITLMVGGELGSEESILSALRRGRVKVANLSGLVLSSLVPELALMQAPFLFENHAEADYLLDNHLVGIYAPLLAEQGLTFLNWDEIGFHHIYGKTPILVPEDVQGVRFRVSAGLSAQYLAEALGADVIPLPFSENLTGLQTGLVDAGTNAVILYARTGIAGEAPHLTLTGQTYAVNLLVANTRWLQSLSRLQRTAVESGWMDMPTARAVTRAEWQADLAAAHELGFIVHELTEDQRAQWRSATTPVAERLITDIGGRASEVWAAIQAAKQAYTDSTGKPQATNEGE